MKKESLVEIARKRIADETSKRKEKVKDALFYLSVHNRPSPSQEFVMTKDEMRRLKNRKKINKALGFKLMSETVER